MRREIASLHDAEAVSCLSPERPPFHLKHWAEVSRATVRGVPIRVPWINSEKQAVRHIKSIPQRLRGVLLVKFPNWQLLVLAAIVGTIWAASLFDWSFVTGRHKFWEFPSGTIARSRLDSATGLVGYFYYVQSSWRLPLFYVTALNTPTGANVIFTDLVPIVALVGKLIRSLTGTATNPYGAYLFLCFALPGVMMTLVLIAANIRYAFAAIIAASFADTTPALLWRWGHTALEAHFLIIGALALYLFSLKNRVWRGLASVWIAYLILAYLTNIYLFAMVGTVWACAIIQRRLDRLATTRGALGTAALTVALVMTVSALSGQFGTGTSLPFDYYGYHSMNLLSPIMPQESGLLPGLGGVIDATGGQYEGFNYLGLGLLLASLIAWPVEVTWLRQNLKRHAALFVAFAALTAFAISHRVFAGHWLLFELPLPHYINQVFGIFRSSGRFFWPIAYAQMAIVIVLSFRRATPLIVVCLASAAVIQLFDVQPLRAKIIASIADGPGAREFDPGEVAHLIAGARHLEVIPSFQCMDERTPYDQLRANMELMLAAARANVPTNTAYLDRYTYGVTSLDALRDLSRAREGWLAARRDDYCKQEIDRARAGGRPGDIFVLLSDQPLSEEMFPGITCSLLSWARYCQRIPESRENSS